mgnify:CR=1 FL=1
MSRRAESWRLQLTHAKRVVVKVDDDAEPILREYVEEGGKRWLRPLNPQYPVIDITHREVAFFGGVVGYWREE